MPRTNQMARTQNVARVVEVVLSKVRFTCNLQEISLRTTFLNDKFQTECYI